MLGFLILAIVFFSQRVLAQNLNVRVNVLIISKPGLPTDSAESVIESLEGYGIPYTLIEVPQSGFTGNFGLEINSVTGNYSSIVFPEGDVQYFNGSSYPSALTTEQWNEIESYERKYKTRRVMMNVYPNEQRFGTTPLGGTGNEEVLTFNGTTLSRTRSNIKSTARLSTKGSYFFYARVTNHSLAIPLCSTRLGTVGVIVNNSATNQESIIFHMAFGNFGITSALLNHAWINWVMKGFIPGMRKPLLSTQIDDVLVDTKIWDTKLKEPTEQKSFRINKSDFEIHAEWTDRINARLPSGSNFKIELAYNGNGVLQYVKKNPIFLKNGVIDANNDFIKPPGNGNYLWPDYNPVNPWKSEDLQTDPLYEYTSSANTTGKYFWVSHTFTHGVLNNVSYENAWNEAYYNQRILNIAPNAEMMKPFYSPNSIVTPQITGLHNGDALQAFWDNGIRCAVGDNTRPKLVHPTKKHWALTTTVEKNGFDGFKILPRHATEIYYHCTNVNENLDAYNFVYNRTLGITTNFNDVLDRESDRVVRYLLLLRKDPHMFHQANMRVSDEEQITLPNGQKGKFSLLMRWVENVITKYTRLVNWPVVTLKQNDLHEAFIDRENTDNCGYELFVRFNAANYTINQVRAQSKKKCKAPLTTIYGFGIGGFPHGTTSVRPSPSEPFLFTLNLSPETPVILNLGWNVTW